jgi:predicted O-methyltransferase YrrM
MLVYALGILAVVFAAYAALLRRAKRRLREKNERLRERNERLREKNEKLRGEQDPDDFPIEQVAFVDLDERFAMREWGPGLETEVAFVGRGDLPVPGAVSDTEAWILSVLAKGSRRIFEFGTCTGRTAYALAANSPDDAAVTTLTLGPDQTDLYQGSPTDDLAAQATALSESRYEDFFYCGTPVEFKVEQLFGDSKAFDESKYQGECDLVFVDGSHAFSYVVSDSRKALRMVRPGGIVLWHDYRGPRSEETRGVFEALNELSRELPLVHIRGTSLVAYRRGA